MVVKGPVAFVGIDQARTRNPLYLKNLRLKSLRGKGSGIDQGF